MESSKGCLLSNSSQVQSSLTEQSKSVGLGVEFVFLPPQELAPTKIYKKEVYYRLVIVKTPAQLSSIQLQLQVEFTHQI